MLTEIDLEATFKKKLDVVVAPQVILDACRPQLARRAVEAEPSIAALLPCNVVVRSIDEGTTVVEAVDPDLVLSVIEDVAGEAMRAVATDGAGYAIVVTGLQQCLSENDGDLDGVNVEKMERLFLSVA